MGVLSACARGETLDMREFQGCENQIIMRDATGRWLV